MLKTISQEKLKRPIIYAFILLAIAVFSYLTREVIEKETLGFDMWLNSQIIQFRNPALTTLMILVSYIGETGGLVIVALLIGFLGLKKEFSRSLALFSITVSALVLTWTLKNMIARSRPEAALRLVTEANFSYPSGHSTIAFTIYPVLVVYIFSQSKIPISLRNALVTFLLIFPFVVAFSRLYLGVHYFTDVLAGAFIGLSLSGLYYSLGRTGPKSEA